MAPNWYDLAYLQLLRSATTANLGTGYGEISLPIIYGNVVIRILAGCYATVNLLEHLFPDLFLSPNPFLDNNKQQSL